MKQISSVVILFQNWGFYVKWNLFYLLMTHTFIIAKLDHCKCLYAGVGQAGLSWLQLEQNTAVRI